MVGENLHGQMVINTKGNFINGVKEWGWGVLTLRVGENGEKIYKGNWKDGKKNGGGKYIFPDGKIVKGLERQRNDEKISFLFFK